MKREPLEKFTHYAKVLVSGVRGIPAECRYDCNSRGFTWRCGQCLNGSLGLNPEIGTICKSCRAKVTEAHWSGETGTVVRRSE
jgi:hypothetical protein